MSEFMRKNDAYDQATNELLRYLVANHGGNMLDAAGYLDDIAKTVPDSAVEYVELAAHIRHLLTAGAIDLALHPYRNPNA